MSASTPASWKAFCKSGRSAPSQRAEEAVSGRITPTLALAAGVAVPDEPDDGEPEPSLPHAATANASAAVISTIGSDRAVFLLIVVPSSGSCGPVVVGIRPASDDIGAYVAFS